MALKTTIRLGGVGGSTTWDATTQVPLYEGDGSPLLSAGQRYGQGSACQFQFLIEDRVGEISRVDLTKGVGSHNVVTISENASGTERWIGRGRVSGVDAGRDGKFWPATKTLTVTVDDGNVDTKGLTLTSTWSRGAESGRARVLAALAAFCNGSPRLTTVISTHLVASGGEVTMPAKDYPAGTELNEIFIDCATVEGKEWGTVIHHDGGSHLCFLYIDDQDHTTYLSTLSISDVPSEVNNTTVFAPHWLQGPAFVADEGDVGHGVVLRWGSAPDQFVVSQDTAYVTSDDYWLNSVNDSLSESHSEAALRATQIRLTRTLAHITHQPTLRMKAEYIHLIEAGMSISIKSAAAMGGQYLNTAQTRRIAQAKKEPIAPQLVGGETGWYYVHLQLDRPLNIFAGKGLPIGPRPAGSGEPTVVAYGRTGTSPTAIVIPDDLQDSMLLVFGAWNSIDVPYKGTYGSALTAVSGSQVINANGAISALYMLNPPADPGGTGTPLSVTNDAGTGEIDKGWVVLENVNQSSPFGSVTTNSGTSTNPTVSVGAGSIAVAAAAGFVTGSPHGSPPTADATAVQTWGVSLVGGIGHRDFAAGYGDASASFTWPASEAWAAVGIGVNGTGSTPENVGDSSDVGTDTGEYANPDHVHGHGTFASGDYHSEYVREAILTTAGDMPYATGASTWTRRAIGASNTHLRSDGTQPIWSPESFLSNPMTSVGDIIKGGTAGAPERLAIGGSNFILKSTGTTPEWANTARLSYLDLDVHTPSNPPTPPAGVIRLYGSNTRAFQKNESGTIFDLTAGGGGGGISGIAVEEDGSEEGTDITRLNFTTNLDVSVSGNEATISASGGGGLTEAYVGYNTVGGSLETMTGLRVYAKQVTLANDCLVDSIEAYVDMAVDDNVAGEINGYIFSDNSGAPQYLLSATYDSGGGATHLLLDTVAGAGGHQNPRWLAVQFASKWLTAGDYWIAVMTSTSSRMRIRYDGSGADRYYTSGGSWVTDWGFYAATTSSNKYSIRAHTIR